MPRIQKTSKGLRVFRWSPLWNCAQVTNACVCTFLHAFSGRMTTSSIKNFLRKLSLLAFWYLKNTSGGWWVVCEIVNNYLRQDYVALARIWEILIVQFEEIKQIFVLLKEKYDPLNVWFSLLNSNIQLVNSFINFQVSITQLAGQ